MSFFGIKRPWTYILLAIVAVGFIMFQVFSIEGWSYNYNGSDDIWFGRFTHSTWIKYFHPDNPLTAIPALFATIAAGIYTAGYIWVQWQGNYTAVFMFAFNPSTFDPWGMSMAWGPFVILCSLSLGCLSLAYTVFTTYMKNPWELSLTLGFFLLIVFSQLVPTYRETFLWWAASVNYPFYIGVMFTMFTCVLRYYRSKKKVLWLSLSWFLAFFVGGGMYVFLTALMVGIPVALYFKEVVYKNKKGRFIYWFIPVFYICCFMNIFAPGNQYRMASVESTAERNPILAIIKGSWFAITTWGTFSVSGTDTQVSCWLLGGATSYCPNGVNWPFIASLFVVAILVFVLVKRVRVVVTTSTFFSLVGLNFLVYAAWYVPFIYGQGTTVMPRVFNGGYMLMWLQYCLNVGACVLWLKPYLIKYKKRHGKSLSQAIFGPAKSLVQLLSMPLLFTVFMIGFFHLNNYANGFLAIRPGVLGVMDAVSTEICQFGDDRNYDNDDPSKDNYVPCPTPYYQTDQADNTELANNETSNLRKTMAQWNVQYINQFKRDLLGGKDVSDELAEKCIEYFWADGCQEQMAKAQTVTLPDTPEEDKILTAHLDMCPLPGYGYNKFAQDFWDKESVVAYYPDFQKPLTSGLDPEGDIAWPESISVREDADWPTFGGEDGWETIYYYLSYKEQQCNNESMADLHA